VKDIGAGAPTRRVSGTLPEQRTAIRPSDPIFAMTTGGSAALPNPDRLALVLL
jgi:hypothetical protein